MLTLNVPDSGWARCPRCDERLGAVRYFRDDIESGYDDDGVAYPERVLSSRASPARGFELVMALPVGWKMETDEERAGRVWKLQDANAKRLEHGVTGIRGRLPKMLGEPGIESLRNAGFLVSADDHIVCSKCHAPMAIAGTSWMGGDYLIRLTERT